MFQMILSMVGLENHVINIDFHLLVDHVMEEGQSWPVDMLPLHSLDQKA